MAPGEFLPWSVMLTLKIAGVLVGIRDVRWVFLWSGCINPSGTLSLLARAGVALPGAGPVLRNFGDHFLLSSNYESLKVRKDCLEGKENLSRRKPFILKKKEQVEEMNIVTTTYKVFGLT